MAYVGALCMGFGFFWVLAAVIVICVLQALLEPFIKEKHVQAAQAPTRGRNKQ